MAKKLNWLQSVYFLYLNTLTIVSYLSSKKLKIKIHIRHTKVWQFACDIFASKHQGAFHFHVVNPNDLLRGFQKRSAYLLCDPRCDCSLWRVGVWSRRYLVYFISDILCRKCRNYTTSSCNIQNSCGSMPVPPYTDCVNFPKKPCENRQSVNHLISFDNGLKNRTALVSTSFEQESGQAVSSLWLSQVSRVSAGLHVSEKNVETLATSWLLSLILVAI